MRTLVEDIARDIRHGWRLLRRARGFTLTAVLVLAVCIGANSAVDRPAVGETRIAAGAKIDNLVQIAHGVRVGAHSLLAAQVGIAGSTVIGEGADSLIFYPLAFYGMPDWPVAALGAVMLSQFVLKVSWEVVLTPVTYAVVGWLKKREGVDVYDVGTDFTPFQTDI